VSRSLGADELRVRSICRQRGIRPDDSASVAPVDEAAQQSPAVGADELRVRAYLYRLGAVL
jgi:hypothetical protein